MKYLVLLALLSCALLPSVVHAGCFGTPLKPGMTHCHDEVDGTWHAVGSDWRNSQCLGCSCGRDGALCCHPSRHTVFPDHCVAKLDLNDCREKLYMKNDPTAPCTGVTRIAGVGK